MKLFLISGSWLLRLMLVSCALLLFGCKDSSDSSALNSSIPTQQPATVLLTQVQISDYIVVSSRRVGRTVTEYTLRAVATNNSATRYTNVTASLTSVPPHITIVDGNVVFGTVIGNDSTTSADEFTIVVDLSVKTALQDLVWQVEGSIPTSGGGGGGGSPDQTGIFMSIDNNSVIKGESTSKSHQEWIELLSFSEGSSIDFSGITGVTRPSGTINLNGVTVSKLLDSSSPALRLALIEGDIFTEVKIDIIKMCGDSIYTAYAITLTVTSLSALQMSAGTADDSPGESLSFSYSRIETMYTPVGQNCRLEAPVYSYQDAIGIK